MRTLFFRREREEAIEVDLEVARREVRATGNEGPPVGMGLRRLQWLQAHRHNAREGFSGHQGSRRGDFIREEALRRDEWIGAYALTEPGSGSDAAAMRTTASLERDEWVLRGTKTFATNASVAKIVVVYARTGPKKHEISAFVVPTDAKGFSVLKKENKMGIRASDTVTLGFDGCRIPKDNLLGELHKGFTIAMATLDGGRIGIAAQALGIAQRALEESTKYAKERQAFGQKIANFQAIQWKLADMATEVDAARLLTYRAAHLEDLGQRHTYESSVAKLFASEAAHRAVDAAVQIHGGYGFVKDYVVEKLYRDQRVTEIYEGTSEIQRLVIARAVLGK